MLSFKDTNDGYYQFADEAPLSWYANLIPCQLMVPPSPTIQQQKDAVQTTINQLESATHMNRFVREAMLLISVQQAQALGLTEPQLYAANPGYKKVKDIDTQIVALRSQKDAIV